MPAFRTIFVVFGCFSIGACVPKVPPPSDANLVRMIRESSSIHSYVQGSCAQPNADKVYGFYAWKPEVLKALDVAREEAAPTFCMRWFDAVAAGKLNEADIQLFRDGVTTPHILAALAPPKPLRK